MKENISKRKMWCLTLLSLLIGLLSFICYPFSVTDGYGGLGYYSSPYNLFKGICIFSGTSIATFFISYFLFDINEKPALLHGKKSSNNKYIKILYSSPFLVSFVTILILYIPYIVATYPSLVQADAIVILQRVLGFDGYGELSTHHPLAYSWLFSYSYKFLSKLLCSSNLAIFTLSMCQMIFVISAMAFSIMLLINVYNANWKIIISLILFFCLCPRINNYMMNITKDVPYAAALLFFISSLWFVDKVDTKKPLIIILIFSSIVVVLTRNEGIIVIAFMLLISCFFSKKRNISLLIFFISLLSFFLFSYFIPSVFNIAKGSGREMLSLPLMQTARYVYTSPELVTFEEEEAILNAFSFNSLEEMASYYDPNTADWIKGNFEYDIFSDNSKAYYKVWFQMMLKQPLVYFNSIIASNYQYLFPCNTFDCAPYNWTEYCFFLPANTVMHENFYFPALFNSYRNTFESVRETIFSVFPFSIFNCPGIVTWSILIWFFSLINKKHWKATILIIPFIIITFVCILSPCNGFYCRYQYPLLICLPIAVCYSIYDYYSCNLDS